MERTPDNVALHSASALEEAHAREDVDRYSELFDPACIWITTRSALIAGREALGENLTRVMPGGLAGGSLRCRLAHALPAGDGAVVAVIDEEYRQPDGTLKDPVGQHRHTYVVTNTSATAWTIVAGQNTTVAADA